MSLNPYNVSKESVVMCDYVEGYRSERIIGGDLITICTQGEALLQVNGEELKFDKYCCIVFFVGDKVTLIEHSDDFRATLIGIGASIMAATRLELPPDIYSNFMTVVHVKLPEQTCDYLLRMIEAVYADKSNVHYLRLIVNSLRQILLNVNNSLLDRSATKSVDRHSCNLCFKFAVLVADHHKQHRNVGYYAEQLSVTPQYLNLIAKRYTGISAKQAINNYIAAALRIALQLPNKTLQDMVDEFNFPDASYFCRYFKQHTGLTVRQYRDGCTSNKINSIIKQRKMQNSSM